MTNTRLGLTPIFVRYAYSFLLRGVGEHRITDHIVYDMAKVTELYPWQPNPVNSLGEDYGGAVRVTFYREGKKIRWAEFSTRLIGGGGEPNVFLVSGEGAGG